MKNKYWVILSCGHERIAGRGADKIKCNECGETRLIIRWYRQRVSY